MENYPASSGKSQQSPSPQPRLPPRYKGVRMRKWGSWVAEVRYPHSRERLWLGSYPTAEQAARAFDAALYCLRGPGAAFNFPDQAPSIPSANKLSKEEIRAAAARFAWEAGPRQGREAEEAGEKMGEVEGEGEMMVADPAAESAMEGSSSPARAEERWNEDENEGWDDCDDIYSSSPLWNF